MSFSESLDVENFQASIGWLNRFESCHEIVLKSTAGGGYDCHHLLEGDCADETALVEKASRVVARN